MILGGLGIAIFGVLTHLVSCDLFLVFVHFLIVWNRSFAGRCRYSMTRGFRAKSALRSVGQWQDLTFFFYCRACRVVNPWTIITKINRHLLKSYCFVQVDVMGGMLVYC